MKKSILVLIILSISLFTISCSNDDSSDSNTNQIYQNLIGKWYFENPTTNPIHNNSFTFTSNGNVIYSYWDGFSGNNYDSETGTFSVEGNVLKMVFPETVTLTYIQKVVFITADKIEFQSTGVTGEEAYEGNYFRDGSTIQDTSFKVELTGTYQTDWCNAVGNTAKVKFEFLQDNNVFATQNEQSSTEQSITVSKDLTGNIIGIRIKLTDYNPANLNAALGDGFESLHLKITGNQTQDVLINTNPPAWLVSCTDICYQIDLLFNTSTKQLTVNSLLH